MPTSASEYHNAYVQIFAETQRDLLNFQQVCVVQRIGFTWPVERHDRDVPVTGDSQVLEFHPARVAEKPDQQRGHTQEKPWRG